MTYNLEKALDRTVRFMEHTEEPGILIRCYSIGPVQLPRVAPLESFQFPDQLHTYLDQTIERHLRFAEAHAALDDDWLPALKPFLGIAEHSSFLRGTVQYGGNTSFHVHPLERIEDWPSLKMDRDEPHYAMLLDGMAYLKKKGAEYGFFSSLRGADGPMDIANAVRGNDLFYDLYDDPETVHAFMAYCAKAVDWTFQNQMPLATEVRGGFISGMDTWLPPGMVGHLSEDASCICSPQMYEEFGLPYTTELLSHYAGALLHVHSLGRACIPYFCRMKKIAIFQLTGDPNQPSALDVYREYADDLRGRAVLLNLTPQEIRDNIDFLRGMRTIINLGRVRSLQEAEEIIDLVRP